MTDRQGSSGGVLPLRNLAMVENIRRAEDPAWRERLERQQVVARLGRMFGRVENLLEAMHKHADALREELRRTPLHWGASRSRRQAWWLRGRHSWGWLCRVRLQRRGDCKRMVAPDVSELVPSSNPQPDGALIKAPPLQVPAAVVACPHARHGCASKLP